MSTTIRRSPYLPPADSRFSVLLTTRVQLGSSVRQLSLDVLSEAAALELLRSLIESERVDRQLLEAKHLCQWLGYLPLGLELVGRYLARKPDLLMTEIQQRLEAQRLDTRALQKVEAGMTATLGVAKAFELSWQDLDEEAQRLSGLLSLFASAPIEWRLVEGSLGDRDSEALEEMRDESLLGLHLLQRIGEGTYQLHPLLRQFFRAKLEPLPWSDELKQRLCRVMVATAQYIPDTPTREQLAVVTPRIAHLEQVATTLECWVEDEEMGRFRAVLRGAGGLCSGAPLV